MNPRHIRTPSQIDISRKIVHLISPLKTRTEDDIKWKRYSETNGRNHIWKSECSERMKNEEYE